MLKYVEGKMAVFTKDDVYAAFQKATAPKPAAGPDGLAEGGGAAGKPTGLEGAFCSSWPAAKLVLEGIEWLLPAGAKPIIEALVEGGDAFEKDNCGN